MPLNNNIISGVRELMWCGIVWFGCQHTLSLKQTCKQHNFTPKPKTLNISS